MNIEKIQQIESGHPFFSVIVPIYNNARELKKCIDSILAQSCRNFELILVDDGSTDETCFICDRYAEEDTRVTVIHKSNEGVVAARNDGLFLAKGSYIYYIDADDWIEKNLLQEAIRVLKTPEPPDIFIFGHTIALKRGMSISNTWPLESGMYNKEQLKKKIYPWMMRTFDKVKGQQLISPSLCDKIIQRDLLLAHYCRDTSLFYREDLVCSYECVYFADKIYFSNSNFYVYNRCSESSMYRKYHKDLLQNNKLVTQYIYNHLGKFGEEAIKQQIDELDFDGVMIAACQEIRFSSSLWNAAYRFKEQLQDHEIFPVCSVENLSFPRKCCVLLLSYRVVYPAFLAIKLLYTVKRILRKWRGRDRSSRKH